MNSDFLDKHKMTNLEILELLQRWENLSVQKGSGYGSSKFNQYNIQWKPPSDNNPALRQNNAITLAEGRDVLYDTMRHYYDDTEPGAILIRAQAGMGKSTSAIKFAQQVADEGGRVLYLMPRHSYWEDIKESPFFEPEKWHHWKATHATDDETGEAMCKLNKHSSEYMRKGYRLIDMCKGLCLHNGHMAVCPYRKQARVSVPIIAGVHNHAVTGLGITNFDLVIVDENAVGAYATERLIKSRNIDTTGKGSLGSLLGTIRELAAKGDKIYARKDLLPLIAEDLRKVLESLGDGAIELDEAPDIHDTNQVSQIKEWYLPELITLLIPELIAYERGLDDWMSRVYVDAEGLHLMIKSAPWVNLPPKVIVLDATGRADICEKLFNMKFTTIEPNVKMKGRIFQIANSLNSISQVLKPKVDGEEQRELTWKGRSLVALCEFITAKFGYKNVGVVVYKGGRLEFESVFGKDNVLHFGGSRGTNQFVSGTPVDCVIVVGSPAPPDGDIIQLASQIGLDPLHPEHSMITLNEGHPIDDARTSTHVEYSYIREDGMAPYRLVGGFWNSEFLSGIMGMYREDEIRQSLHRGRPLTRECDVWLLTSVPTTEPLTGFYEKPEQLLADDSPISWRNWLRVYQAVNLLEPGEYDAADLAYRMGTKGAYAKRWTAGFAAQEDGYEWKDDTLTVI